MAEIKVSEMLEAESVNDEDLIMIVQKGVNKKVPASKVGTGQAGGDTLPIGAVLEWNSDIIPTNWLLCDGQEVSRTEYSELFEVLGTKYGEGDGSTTFNLPNRKGNVAVGKDEEDTDFNELGKTGGEKEHTLTVDEMPKHKHGTPIDSYVNTDKQTDQIQGGHISNISQGTNFNTLYAGGNKPHNNLQPYIVSNFIIKAKQSAGLVATVVDNLESESETDALSAKQGKELNDKFSKSVLWENKNVSSEFAAQTITLLSSEYDYLIIYSYRNYLNEGGGDKRTITCLVEKNGGGEITFSDYLGEVRAWNRRYMISDDINVTFWDAVINKAINNITLVPYKIIGCKY